MESELISYDQLGPTMLATAPKELKRGFFLVLCHPSPCGGGFGAFSVLPGDPVRHRRLRHFLFEHGRDPICERPYRGVSAIRARWKRSTSRIFSKRMTRTPHRPGKTSSSISTPALSAEYQEYSVMMPKWCCTTVGWFPYRVQFRYSGDGATMQAASC